MKKFSFATAVLVVMFLVLSGLLSLSLYAARGSSAPGARSQTLKEIVAPALPSKTGTLIVTAEDGLFYPELQPEFNGDNQPQYMPVFTFKRPATPQPFNRLTVILRLSKALEIKLSGYAGNSWDINVANVYAQRLVVNEKTWPKAGVKSAPLGYHPLGIQIKLTCQTGYCRGDVPQAVLKQLLQDTKPGEEFSLTVAGYELDEALRADGQSLVFDNENETGTGQSEVLFSW